MATAPQPVGAVGITVKSGWASVVLIVGAGTEPRVADSQRIDLSDPAVPEARQPYHAAFGTARAQDATLTRLVGSVKRFGRRAVTDLMRRYKATCQLRGAGIVVGSLIDPARIGNDHIRIHALEGELFREVVQGSVSALGLTTRVVRERDLYTSAVVALGRSEPALRAQLARLGQNRSGPWRAEEKSAALAAWLSLTGRRSRRGSA